MEGIKLFFWALSNRVVHQVASRKDLVFCEMRKNRVIWPCLRYDRSNKRNLILIENFGEIIIVYQQFFFLYVQFASWRQLISFSSSKYFKNKKNQNNIPVDSSSTRSSLSSPSTSRSFSSTSRSFLFSILSVFSSSSRSSLSSPSSSRSFSSSSRSFLFSIFGVFSSSSWSFFSWIFGVLSSILISF